MPGDASAASGEPRGPPEGAGEGFEAPILVGEKAAGVSNGALGPSDAKLTVMAGGDVSSAEPRRPRGPPEDAGKAVGEAVGLIGGGEPV